MTIAKGAQLGPYEIVSQIGAGGMGEVWRARDKRLRRDVAVKVLPRSFLGGDEQVRRFEQEARAAGGLNHPGLVTIFDIGTTGGAPYIVMELLEGRTLRDVLGDAVLVALPVRKVIDYGVQIALALAAAHEKGIVHRDLKPENVFITSDGRAKILDFGLAKLAPQAQEAGADVTAQQRRLTSAGMVVGTPNYMSPEQAQAKALDHRSDIFSLGAMLYEMLCGRRAFERDSVVETMHAVIAADPPSLPSIDPRVPPAVDAIVRHCIEKDPHERFQSARDLAFQLRMLPEPVTGTTAVLPTPLPMRRVPYRRPLIAAAVLLAAIVLGVTLVRGFGRGAPPPDRMFRQLTFSAGVKLFPTLSPDGKTIAYVSSESGNRDIYVQRVDGQTSINITADSPDDDSEPAFSPDGAHIAFRSERGGGGIFVMGATGESVIRLTNFGHNPSWSPDGNRIVVSTAATDLRPQVHPAPGDLYIVDARSGERRLLFKHEDRGSGTDALQPSWSPHGNRIAFWGVSGQGAAQRMIRTIDPDAADPKRTVVRVTSDPALDWNPVWSADGKFLYFGSDRDGTLNLWRIAMEESTGEPAGTPEPVSLPGRVNGDFTVSHGSLAFTTVTRSYRLLAMTFDASSGKTGPPRLIFGGSLEILSFAPSPDGTSIAFTTTGGQEDVYVVNADGTHLRQLTNDPWRDRWVAWAPDGRRLFFYSNRGGAYQIWSVHLDGSGLERETDPSDLRRIGTDNIFTPSVSPDGRTLAAEVNGGTVLVHLDRPLNQRLERLPVDMSVPVWSPDATKIAGIVPGAVAVYSLQSRKTEEVRKGDASAQWTPDGKNVVTFERGSIGIASAAGGEVAKSPFTAEGVDFGGAVVAQPRLSRDGATLYVCQTIEQGDVYLMRFGKS